MAFDVTELMKQKKDFLVDIVETKTKKVLFTGHIPQVAGLIKMSHYQVIGYAEWGYPCKSLKKHGYYLRWSFTQNTEQ